MKFQCKTSAFANGALVFISKLCVDLRRTPKARRKLFFFAALSLLLAGACSQNFTDNPKPNRPPETYISIFSDNVLNASISKKTINWWGDDPDGLVVGFIYSFDPRAPNVESWDAQAPVEGWIYTTNNQETFTLRLSGTDTVYTFRVKAVDDYGAADPTPAVQEFPIINTRPEVEFVPFTDVPETTFTVVNFNWRGIDLDGDDTIAGYQWALDDSSNAAAWHELPAGTASLLLTAADGLTEGEHVFYLRAIDIAGATSAIARMPRDTADVWFVREPKSSFLLLDDYNVSDNTDAFYRATFRSLVGEVEVWDIKSKGKALEPPTGLAFRETLKLFDRVFWYADTEPNLEKAQVSVIDFLDSGGKLIMTTSFQEFASNIGDPLAFSPVDSLGPKIRRITRNQRLLPGPEFAGAGFPELTVGTAIIPNVFPLVPKLSSKVLYLLPENAGVWEGTPAMAVVDGTSSFVFFGLPIVALDGQGNVAQMLEKILTQVLGE